MPFIPHPPITWKEEYPPITWKEEIVSRKQENVPYLVPAHHLHVEGSGFRVQGSGLRVEG